MSFDIKKFQGIIAPIVNPCNEDDSLDEQALMSNLKRLMRTDIAGLYINGGTGDAANLTQDERLRTASLLIPPLLKEKKLAIVHVGQTCQRCAVELALQAKELGAHAVASIPPKKPWQQAADYYRALANTGMPVIVYYIPGVTGMSADMGKLRILLDIPGVVGIKMSDWNVFLLRSVKLEYPEKAVYSGFDEMLLAGLLYGADGCIGTWVNLFPELYTKIYSCVRSGRIQEALPAANAFTRFLAMGWNYGILDTFEELMRAKGYANRCFRRPTSWDPGKVDERHLGQMLKETERIRALAKAL